MCVAVHAEHAHVADSEGGIPGDSSEGGGEVAPAESGLDSMPAACAQLWLPVDATLMEGYTCSPRSKKRDSGFGFGQLARHPCKTLRPPSQTMPETVPETVPDRARSCQIVPDRTRSSCGHSLG